MAQCINRGARETVAAQPMLRGCPACGFEPAVDMAFHGRVVVYCDFDGCEGLGDGWPQKTSDTLAEAAAKWNSMGEDT